MARFEKVLKIGEAIGDNEGIAIAKRNIADAKSKYKGGNNEELSKASQELYEFRVAEFGKEHEYTIDAGIDYAVYLRKANRRDEASELMTKLFATSKQVLGSDHNITKEVEMALEELGYIHSYCAKSK
jgi:hypothetical protein